VAVGASHHRDVSLPDGWQLNRMRLPVPPPPVERRALHEEMCRHMERLPPSQWYEPVYQREDLWRAFLA
jgi:hypothetical protein